MEALTYEMKNTIITGDTFFVCISLFLHLHTPVRFMFFVQIVRDRHAVPAATLYALLTVAENVGITGEEACP